jgi:hypothetical protein
MTAAELHALFEREGKRTLPPLGFRYRAHAWHRTTADTQCPVRISPTALAAFVGSDFDDRHWDCPPVGQCAPMTQEPVYFGGPDFRILADPSASNEQNRAALLHVLEPKGVDDLSEESTAPIVTRAFDRVAAYALAWAEHASAREVRRLLTAHRDRGSPHLSEEWVDSYTAAA